jgi:hypothetical protein
MLREILFLLLYPKLYDTRCLSGIYCLNTFYDGDSVEVTRAREGGTVRGCPLAGARGTEDIHGNLRLATCYYEWSTSHPQLSYPLSDEATHIQYRAQTKRND